MSKLLSMVEHSLIIFSSAVMCIITFANVISRYVTGNSFAFTEEITINIFVLLVFTGASVGVKNSAHLGFTLLFDRAKLPFKKILCVFSGILVTAVFLLFAYYGVDMVLYQMSVNQMTPALGWHQWMVASVFPLGCILCIIRSIEVSVIEYKNLRLESE